jgi:hypothetical protein
VRYELCFYIPEDDILHSHGRESLKPYEPSAPKFKLFALCLMVALALLYYSRPYTPPQPGLSHAGAVLPVGHIPALIMLMLHSQTTEYYWVPGN